MDNRGFSLIEILVVVALMAALAIYLGTGTSDITENHTFYQTCYKMEKIKDAIIGRSGMYCNGIRQFTGYVSDMGNLPDLFYTDSENEVQKVTQTESGQTQALEGDGGLAWALLNGFSPMPHSLWKNRDDLLPEWKYYSDYRLWAGWRGPYLAPPRDGALRDAWGHRFLFVIGDVIAHQGKTYRCKQTYKAQLEPDDPHDPMTPPDQGRPGEADEYWEVIDNSEMNFRIWQDLGTARDEDGNEVEDLPEDLYTKQEIFYGDSCLTIISLGRDGEPGGDGLDKDIVLVIEPTEFTGEVAGNAGDRDDNNLLAKKVCLYFPDFTEERDEIKELCIPSENESESELENNSQPFIAQPEGDEGACYTGINFRFGTTASYTAECLTWECDRSDGSCTCTEYEQGDCLWFVCKPANYGKTPDGCTCTMPIGSYCVNAKCDYEPDNWTCTCDEYDYSSCKTWECDNLVDGAECTCSEQGESVEDYTNTCTDQNIPIGIRTLSADSNYYMISVNTGGNWIGTVGSGD